MKYNKEDIADLAVASCKGDERAYSRLGEFAWGISEELAKGFMKKHHLDDTFVLEEMRSRALEHFSSVFLIKFDHTDNGCAASYIIGMLRNSMIDYLRSLSRADKFGELNKSFSSVPDEHGVVRKRLVQVVKDDYLSETITDIGGMNSCDIDVNDLDFNDDYIWKK